MLLLLGLAASFAEMREQEFDNHPVIPGGDFVPGRPPVRLEDAHAVRGARRRGGSAPVGPPSEGKAYDFRPVFPAVTVCAPSHSKATSRHPEVGYQPVPARAVAAFLALIISSACGEKGGRQTVPDEVTCPQCSVGIEKIASLGSAADPASHALFATVSRDSRGRFFVAPVQGGGQILAYRSDASFDTLLGKTGRGPGEFSPRIARVEIGPGDSLFVVDWSLQRIAVWSPEYNPVRTAGVPLSPPMDAWALPAGRIALQGWSQNQAEDSVRHLYHVLERAGWKLGSSTGPEWTGDVPVSYQPELATRPQDGRFWTLGRRHYELQQWNLDGELVRTMPREAPWFPDDTAKFVDFQNPYMEKPEPFIQGIAQDEDGRLWVITDVADQDWAPSRDRLGTEEEPLTPGNARPDSVFDTVLEIIDPSAGSVLVRKRFSRALRVVRTPGEEIVFFSYSSGNLDVPVIHVWNPQLKGEYQ